VRVHCARALCVSPGIKEVDEDGILKDIDVLDIAPSSSHIKNKGRSRDIQEFFGPAYDAPGGTDSKPHKFRDCKPCR
jgi:hypothetical protein